MTFSIKPEFAHEIYFYKKGQIKVKVIQTWLDVEFDIDTDDGSEPEFEWLDVEDKRAADLYATANAEDINITSFDDLDTVEVEIAGLDKNDPLYGEIVAQAINDPLSLGSNGFDRDADDQWLLFEPIEINAD